MILKCKKTRERANEIRKYLIAVLHETKVKQNN